MDSDTIAGLTKCFPASALSAKHTKMNPDVGLIRRAQNQKERGEKNQFGDSSKLFPRSRMMTATQGQCGIYSAHRVVGLFLFFSSQCTVSNERQPRRSQCAAALFKRRRVALLTARSASSEKFDFQGNRDLFFLPRRGSIICFFRK